MMGSLRLHLDMLADSWRAETERRRTQRRERLETDFLPAALEVTETPHPPAGRAVMWLIILAAAGAIAWAFLSKVEMVAVAEGRIIPTARLQAVEAAEAGIVRAILVTEGQRVARGQPLVRLDATLSDADEAAARADLSAALLQRARAVALLAHSTGGDARFHPPPGAASDAAAAEEQAVTARIAEHLSRRAGLAQRRAGVVAARQDKAVQQARARETMAQAAMLDREMAQADAEFRARAAAEQAEAEAVIATRSELVKKAEQRTTLQVLTAPTDGIINEILVTSTGEVLEVGRVSPRWCRRTVRWWWKPWC